MLAYAAAARSPARSGSPRALVLILAGHAVLIGAVLLWAFFRYAIFRSVVIGVGPLLGLITATLGSILAGLATPTEAAGIGAVGAVLLALAYGRFTPGGLQRALVRLGEAHRDALALVALHRAVRVEQAAQEAAVEVRGAALERGRDFLGAGTHAQPEGEVAQ